MENISDFKTVSNFDELHALMCRSEGTLDLGEVIIKPNVETPILILPCSGHIFQLIYTIDSKLVFYYSNTGIGTKVATLDISPEELILTPLRITITWSQTGIALYTKLGDNFYHTNGEDSEIDFKVDCNGNIVRIGDVGVKVKNVRIIKGGKLVLSPSAIETWKNTLETLEILQNNTKNCDYCCLVAIANVSFVALVSGFEVYLKKRFVEIANEGFPINKLEIIRLLHKSESLDSLSLKDIVEKANPNFQNWDIGKDLFNKVYGIEFNKLVSLDVIENIKKSLIFRHRLVHVSLNITMVNELSVPPEEPIFSTKYLATAIQRFDEFIKKLHEKTLEL